MQRNFYTDDFEQLIRQIADQYKMYPSDHVWKGVHRALHGRRRWYWTGLAILLLGAGLLTGKRGQVEALCSGFQLDISQIKRTLKWAPPQSSKEAIRKAVAWYREASERP